MTVTGTLRWACHRCGSLLAWSLWGVRCSRPTCQRRASVLREVPTADE